MRLISLTVRPAEPRHSARLYKALRRVDRTLQLGFTIAAIKSGRPVLELETDCMEAVARLDLLLELTTDLASQNIGFELFRTELLPSPIDGAPPRTEANAIGLSDLQSIRDFENEIMFRVIPQHLEDVLKRLDEASWFLHIGEPVLDSSVSLANASEVEPASRDWRYALGEAQNFLTETLCYQHHYRFQRRWNPFAVAIAPRVSELVARNRDRAPDAVPNAADFWTSIGSMVRTGCFELYFSDVVFPSYGTNWLNWLFLGRVPCGWQGRFPMGRLLIL